MVSGVVWSWWAGKGSPDAIKRDHAPECGADGDWDPGEEDERDGRLWDCLGQRAGSAIGRKTHGGVSEHGDGQSAVQSNFIEPQQPEVAVYESVRTSSVVPRPASRTYVDRTERWRTIDTECKGELADGSGFFGGSHGTERTEWIAAQYNAPLHDGTHRQVSVSA